MLRVEGSVPEVLRWIERQITKNSSPNQSASTTLLMKKSRCINPMHSLYVELPGQELAIAHIEIVR